MKDEKSESINQSIVNLFNNLASYYRHENDLSNVTVSLCNSSIDFLRLFVHFFFPKIKIEDIESVEREVWDSTVGESRVDIMINLKSNETYLIEVKINDEKHHFGKYETDFEIDNKHLGYIVNYELSKVGYDVKKWKQFYYYLKDNLKSVTDEFQHSMIYGFMELVKTLCGFTDYNNPMNLNNIHFLHQFFDIASNLLCYATDTYSVTVGKLASPTSANRLAPYMCLAFNVDFADARRKNIEMALFLYTSYEEPLITIAVDKEYNQRLSAKLNNVELKHKGKFFNEAYMDDDDWYGSEYMWFDMKQTEKFLNTQDLKEQESLLSKYFKEVIDYCTDC